MPIVGDSPLAIRDRRRRVCALGVRGLNGAITTCNHRGRSATGGSTTQGRDEYAIARSTSPSRTRSTRSSNACTASFSARSGGGYSASRRLVIRPVRRRQARGRGVALDILPLVRGLCERARFRLYALRALMLEDEGDGSIGKSTSRGLDNASGGEGRERRDRNAQPAGFVLVRVVRRRWCWGRLNQHQQAVESPA